MNHDFFHEILTQLACRIPTLFVCVVGFALSAAFWRRLAAIVFLALIAAVLFGAAAVGHAFLSSIDPPFEDDASFLDALTLGENVGQAIAIGLLFTAALVGRQSTRLTDFDDG